MWIERGRIRVVGHTQRLGVGRGDLARDERCKYRNEQIGTHGKGLSPESPGPSTPFTPIGLTLYSLGRHVRRKAEDGVEGFFVTGTDTNVGKTLVAAWLVGQLDGCYWKPVQAGTRPKTDSDVVRRLSGAPSERIM